ncbi:hypothetical protein IC582_019489 [Cucumis melo]
MNFCLEWRYTYPLLEEAGLETWVVDVLGRGFSDLDQIGLTAEEVISKIMANPEFKQPSWMYVHFNVNKFLVRI